ncbi:MAG: transporter, Spinster family, sphingosine-phosphate transporter [Phycisphaerales bacterium]|jgi:MFS family permease|nr:transporter, Spinster family, sphingosine-phosphate transporter [Phycisphaerales bacterium]
MPQPGAPSDNTAPPARLPGARPALLLLLGINLFNYVDRQVLAAVEPLIREEFGVSQATMGWLATAFLLSYMLCSPIFGWLGDRTSRWLLVAVGVILWSLASGATGLATTFGVLLLTRCFVGIGEAAYGPVAPTILSDLFPLKIRGRILAWFFLAIPLGSALGYVFGGAVASATGSWRWPFYLVVAPGIVLGVWALFMRDPRREGSTATPATIANPTQSNRPRMADYLVLLKIRSYVLDCAGMTAMTFAIGGIGFWMPTYIYEYRLHKTVDLGRINTIFGVILCVAGFAATMLGGIAGDALRKRFAGSYFLVSAAGLLTGFPMLLMILFTPFPYAWIFVGLAVFCLFFNTGPSNTILANVTPPRIRATAFALNILFIHALGDAISPPVIGWISDRFNMDIAFGFVSLTFLIGGLFWLWGAKYLERDTLAVAAMSDPAESATESQSPSATPSGGG